MDLPTKKICKECSTEKSSEEFYVGTQTGKNGQVWKYLDSSCKLCRIAYQTERRQKRKLDIIEYMGGCCIDCGLIDIPEVYDCHHLDPSKKDFSPAKTSSSFESIRYELDKCVLLCANCHRKRHARGL